MSDEHIKVLRELREPYACMAASHEGEPEGARFLAHVAALDAAIAALGGEPNMRHPKIQALIGASARRSIELSLIESLLFDPEFEMAGSDWDYETALVTKVMALRDKLYALPAPPSKEGVRMESCPKCAREWEAPCQQTWCIAQYGECIACRFGAEGEGTAAEFDAIPSPTKETP